jgi:hypothetical protein
MRRSGRLPAGDVPAHLPFDRGAGPLFVPRQGRNNEADDTEAEHPTENDRARSAVRARRERRRKRRSQPEHDARMAHQRRARWLDSQQHYRGATPNHFINVVHDPLIGRRQSAVLEFDPWPQLDGALLDAKWSYGKHHGAWGKVLRDKTDGGVEILDDHSSLSSSKDRPLTFRGCFAPQMSAAPGGSSRPNTIRTSDKRSLRVESQAA